MKRDMEVVRSILKYAAETQNFQRIEGVEAPTFAYHVKIMVDAGLIEGIVRADGRGIPSDAVVRGLTWEGNDFLDAAKDDSLWKKAQDKLLIPGASMSFGLLKDWLISEAKKQIGLA